MGEVVEEHTCAIAVSDSEARLRRVLDTVVAFVGALTPQGVLTEANELALALANLRRKDVIGKPFWECYWWNYSPEVQAQLRDAIARAAAGETVRYDVDVRVAEGALITIDFQVAPNYAADGTLIELIPSGVDITERKQFEEQLRRNEEIFSKLVRNAPFGVYLVDSDFRLREVSAGAQKVFSTIQPHLGRDFAELLRILWPEPFASEAISRFRHTLKTGEPYRSADTREQRADTADMEAYDWQIERIVLPDGQFGVVCYYYDLTAQMRAETALRESEARLSQILDNVNTFIGLLDAEGILTEANTASLNAGGISRDEVIGKPFKDTPWWTFSPEVQQQMEAIVARSLSGKTVRDDLLYRSADGDVRWVDFQIAPVFAEDGSVVAVVPSGVDITERKSAEQSLADSASAYRMALTAARSGAWEWDIADDRVVWSPEVGKLLGIADDDFPGTIGEFLAFLPDDDRRAVRGAIQRSISSGDEDYEIECRVRRGDNGRLMWVRGTGEIVRDAAGVPLRIRGLVSDIDDLRRAQQVSHEREARIQSLLNSTAEGIYGIDPNGIFTFANPACARMVGFDSPSQLIGRRAHDVIHHHHADGEPYPLDDCQIYRAFQTGERVHVDDEVFWRADGSSFPVEYWSYPIEEKGRIVGSVVTFLDITERRRAEEQIRLAAERLGLAIESGKMGVWDWDLLSGAGEWSDYLYSMAGYDAGEISPGYDALRARIHPADRRGFEEAMEAARNSGGDYESAFRLRHPDGKEVDVIAHGRFFRDDEGRPVRMVGVVNDITSLKAAEEHREMLLGELNHRVKNTLATIQAMASHTLRNSPDPETFRDTFVGRLHAIAAAHDILTGEAKIGADLNGLIARQVGLYADIESGQLHVEGPNVRLAPPVAHALGLAVHELATNAAKYGALSDSTGRVEITWQLSADEDKPAVTLAWREIGGPPVEAPSHKGFGSRLIEQTLKHTLSGEVTLEYRRDGFRATLKFPMDAGSV